MNQQESTVLRITDLSFAYPGQTIFKNMSVNIPTGVSLIRCEESRGKSTLVQLLAGELRPDHGTIRANGLDSSKDTHQYRKEVYFIDPRTDRFDQLSAIQYLAQVEHEYSDFDRTIIPELITGLGLTPHQDKPLYMLSAGSKRKVWIAAALANGAKITLIDDLTAALDRGSIEFIIDQLIRISKNDKRHFIVSHFDMLERVPFASIINI